MSLGANSYLTKPVNVKDLVMAVLEQLEERTARPRHPLAKL